jgi:Secretion system C-terminal sorting domain
MINSNTGFVVGDSGIILKTTNGGVLTAINTSPVLPDQIELFQNYPNPFNPTTTIRYVIPKESFVTIKVYNLLGKEIATLVNDKKSAGSYSVDFNTNNFASGIYFYKLLSGTYTATKKMVILK